MSLGCNIEEVKNNAFEGIKHIMEGNSTTIKMSDSGVVSFNYGNSSKYKSERQAKAIAQKKINEAREYIKNEIGPAFQHGWFIKPTAQFNGKYQVNFNFPKYVETAYNKKFASDKATIDAQMKVEGENYFTEYDDLLGVSAESSEGFNFANHLEQKTALREVVRERIKVLQNKAQKTKGDLEQIERFKDIQRNLKSDLQDLIKVDSTLNNYLTFFGKDLATVEQLLNQPEATIEDITTAKRYVGMLNAVTEVQTNDNFGLLEQSIESLIREAKEDPEVSEEDLKNLQEVEGKLDAYKARVLKIEEHLRDQERGVVIKAIEDHLAKTTDKTQKEIEAESEALYLQKVVGIVEDVSAMDQYRYNNNDLDKDLMTAVISKIFNDAEAKTQTKDLRQRLENINDSVKDRLIQNGHVAERSFIGRLASKADYGVFFRKNQKGQPRLVSKFSESWNAYRRQSNGFNHKIQDLEYKNTKGTSEYSQIKKLREDHFDSLKDNVDFIDYTRIPEIIEDETLSKGRQYNGTSEMREKYKAELIAKVGQAEYNNFVQQARENILDYQISAENYEKIKKKQYGIENLKDMPEEAYDRFNENLVNRNPFFFSEANRLNGGNTISKAYQQQGKSIGITTPADLRYALYTPKTDNDQFYDQNFKDDIESDEVLLEAWRLMKQGVDFINDNGFNSNRNVAENSVFYQRELLDEVLKKSKGFRALGFMAEATVKWMQNIFTTSNKVDTNDPVAMRVKSGLTTVDQEASSRAKIFLNTLGTSENLEKPMRFKDLDPKIIKQLAEGLGITESRVKAHVGDVKSYTHRKFAEKVMNETPLDFIDTLASQLDIVESYKSKIEVENEIGFLQEIANKTQEQGRNGLQERTKAKSMLDLFITRKLYGVNNRENWNMGANAIKVYNLKERQIRTTAKEAIKVLKAEKTELADAEVAKLEAFLNEGGRSVTIGTLYAATIFKLARLSAFTFNVPNQIVNKSIGGLTAKEMDGKLWTDGNYYKAKNFARQFGGLKRTMSKNQKENYKITTSLLNRLEVFQNSANEMFKVEKTAAGSITGAVFSKKGIDVLALPGLVEKAIQRPQILAMLGDEKITDKDGNEVPVFDVNDSKNPWKAFRLDGENLELKDEFRTDSNVATWLQTSSQEYANLFGDSGKVPKAIALINGDYRDGSSYYADRNLIGATLFMFKRWFPATLNKRLKSYVTLGEAGATKEGAGIVAQRAVAIGMNTGSMIGLLGAAGATGYIKYKSLQEHNKELENAFQIIGQMGKDLGKSLINYKFYIGGARTFAAATAKAVQLYDPMHLISNEAINKIAGYNKLDVSPEKLEQAKKELQFQLTSYANVLALTAARILVMALLAPDEDEKKRYRKKVDSDTGYFDRLNEDTGLTMYYTLNNLAGSLVESSDALDTQSMFGTINPFQDSRTMEKIYKLLSSFDEQHKKGNYSKGEYAGYNRTHAAVNRLGVPGLFKGGSLNLGFNTYSKRDFVSDYLDEIFVTDYDKAKKDAKYQKDQAKLNN